MIRIVEYNEGLRQRWSTFVEKMQNATVAHQIGWKDAIRQGLGHKPVFLIALEGDNVRGVLPLFLIKTMWGSRYLISVPWIDYGGICAADSRAENALLEETRRIAEIEKARFVEFRSVDAVFGDLPVMDDKVTFLLELNKDPEVIFKGFNSKLRNQIRKAQKSKLTAQFGGLELLPDFYRIFSWKMHSLGTPVWGYSHFENILKVFPGTAQIILVKKDEESIAGGLVLAFKDRLYVPSAAAYRSALKFCPNHALYWEVVKKGCDEGYEYFDFGRSRIDSSTYKFKIQWVPEPTQLKWQYHLARAKEMPKINPGSPKYRLFINIWKKLPLSAANYLGPRVIKNFP